MEYGFDWPSGFRDKVVEINGHIHVLSPRTWADNPSGKFIFINEFIHSI